MSLSRRNLLSSFFKPLKAGTDRARTTATPPASSPPPNHVAVIQGRFCLAYQQGFCSVCYERCPVPQAIEMDDGIPRIVLERCTGCGVCRDVCPAPENAILIVPRRPGVGA